MPENWQSDVMAMCCGLSLAIALGWNVTAGAAEWRQLAQHLCIVNVADLDDGACDMAAARALDQPSYLTFGP